MSKVVTGLFNNPRGAASAVHSMDAVGVPDSDISVIATDAMDRESFAITDQSKLPEGIAIGAGAGGALAAIAAGLTAVGTLATGGAGLIAAGPIVAALAGGGAGALTGGVLGGVIGAAIPEHEIKHYENSIEQGSVLVGAKVADELAGRVEEIFEQCGAENVSHA